MFLSKTGPTPTISGGVSGCLKSRKAKKSVLQESCALGDSSHPKTEHKGRKQE
jgi:hypothetical protein